MRKPASGGLAYSTEGGRMCPVCRRPQAACACAERAAVARRGDGIVRVTRESHDRGGKTVTVIRGVDRDDATLAALGKRLRAACGSGGTVKDGMVEVQGDHRDRIVALLQQDGYVVKRAGG